MVCGFLLLLFKGFNSFDSEFGSDIWIDERVLGLSCPAVFSISAVHVPGKTAEELLGYLERKKEKFVCCAVAIWNITVHTSHWMQPCQDTFFWWSFGVYKSAAVAAMRIKSIFIHFWGFSLAPSLKELKLQTSAVLCVVKADKLVLNMSLCVQMKMYDLRFFQKNPEYWKELGIRCCWKPQ